MNERIQRAERHTCAAVRPFPVDQSRGGVIVPVHVELGVGAAATTNRLFVLVCACLRHTSKLKMGRGNGLMGIVSGVRSANAV